MKTMIEKQDRHCSRQQCINCFVLNGCVYMSNAYDVPDSWDISFADNNLFKRRQSTIHTTDLPVHTYRSGRD
jgi:hypothetical protein